MLSMKEPVAATSSNRKVAVYKGLRVAVFTVDKTDLSLSRSDLIELINVCIILIDFILSLIRLLVSAIRICAHF